MKAQLISYVDLLFAGAEDADDIKQEILQNTLDRYDDLLSQGKSPQAAYSLAISGIGDISELLEHSVPSAPTAVTLPTAPVPNRRKDKKLMQAVAIGMYICCVVPVIALSNVGAGTIGVVLMFLMIAAATVLIILSDDGRKEKKEGCNCSNGLSRTNPMKKTVQKIISTVGLCVYFILSFATGAWYITWLIFPIMAAVRQLINAIWDLKEGN